MNSLPAGSKALLEPHPCVGGWPCSAPTPRKSILSPDQLLRHTKHSPFAFERTENQAVDAGFIAQVALRTQLPLGSMHSPCFSLGREEPAPPSRLGRGCACPCLLWASLRGQGAIPAPHRALTPGKPQGKASPVLGRALNRELSLGNIQ